MLASLSDGGGKVATSTSLDREDLLPKEGEGNWSKVVDLSAVVLLETSP